MGVEIFLKNYPFYIFGPAHEALGGKVMIHEFPNLNSFYPRDGDNFFPCNFQEVINKCKIVIGGIKQDGQQWCWPMAIIHTSDLGDLGKNCKGIQQWFSSVHSISERLNRLGRKILLKQ